MTNIEGVVASSFVLRHSFVIRASTFGIRRVGLAELGPPYFFVWPRTNFP